MYQGGIETAIKEAVGFELLLRGIEVVSRLLLRGMEIAIKVHVENVLKMHALFLSKLNLHLQLRICLD